MHFAIDVSFRLLLYIEFLKKKHLENTFFMKNFIFSKGYKMSRKQLLQDGKSLRSEENALKFILK